MTTYCYLRCSTSDGRQRTDSQKSALSAFCKARKITPRWIEDYASGKSIRRDGLQTMLRHARTGDSIIVTDLSRFSRSLKDTLTLCEDLTKRGISLSVLNQNLTFDPKSAMSTFMLQIFGAINELSSSILGDRVRHGLALAKQRGVRLGGVPDLRLRARVRKMRQTMSVKEIAANQKCSRQNIYHLLEESPRRSA